MSEDTNVQSEGKTVEALFAKHAVYSMPLFQRGYVWGKKNFKEYWKDLESLIKGEEFGESSFQTSFLGALVLQEDAHWIEDASASKRGVLPKRYIVIDGQQRLTTFYLTLLALLVYATERVQRLHEQESKGKKLDKDDWDGWQNYANSFQHRNFLFSHEPSNLEEIKIRPSRDDYPQFNSAVEELKRGLELEVLEGNKSPLLLSGEREGDGTGKLFSAYRFLQKEIKSFITKGGSDATEQRERYGQILRALINRTEVVQIITGPNLSPNNIFDRLNTSGVRLGTLDWVRNDIFGRLPLDKDKGFSEGRGFSTDIWEPFENKLKDVSKIADLNKANKATEKQKRIEKQSEGFFVAYGTIDAKPFSFKERIRDLKEHWDKESDGEQGRSYGGSQIIVKSLEGHLPSYLALCAEKEPAGIDPKLWELIQDMKNLLLPESTYPFLMPVIRSSIEEKLPVEHAMQAFKIVESLVVRLTFLGKSMASLTAVFHSLWTECKKEKMTPELILQGIKSNFPITLLENDEEIKRNILNASVYGKRRTKYILMQYEKELGKNRHSLTLPLHECHIDHIMPQAKSKANGATAGEEERARLCGTFGNLTLLDPEINSLKSAKNFEAVKHLLEGSDLRSVKALLEDFDNGEFDSWGTDAIEKRGKKLAHWAVKRWPLTPEKF